METLNTFHGLKKGDKIQVISKNRSTGISKNRIITIKDYIGDNYSAILYNHQIEENIPNMILHAWDCIITENNLNIPNESQLKKMKDSLIKLEEDYNTKKESLEKKIKFCEDNKLDQFDEKLFKVYTAIDLVQSGGSKLEQAKAILEVVNIK